MGISIFLNRLRSSGYFDFLESSAQFNAFRLCAHFGVFRFRYAEFFTRLTYFELKRK